MSAELENNPLLIRLAELAPQAVEDAQTFRGELTLFIHRPRLRHVCQLLRDEPEFSFKFMADLTALDGYPDEPRFEVVYHLLCMDRAERLRLKVRLPGDNPRVDSMVPVWPAANAFEREVFDLFGIQFEGHPFLRRILMPEDWEGHPLRKDYPVQGSITRWP